MIAVPVAERSEHRRRRRRTDAAVGRDAARHQRPRARAARRRPGRDRGRTLDGHHCSSIMHRAAARRHLRRDALAADCTYSADGGETWEPRANGITIEHVFSLGYAHEGEHTVLYAGTEPASIFRSDDYGLTWTEQPGREADQGRDKWSFPSPPHHAHVKTMTDRSARPARDLCRRRAGRSAQDDRRRRDLARARRLFEAQRLDLSRHPSGRRASRQLRTSST